MKKSTKFKHILSLLLLTGASLAQDDGQKEPEEVNLAAGKPKT